MCVVCFVGVLANGFGFLLANGFVSWHKLEQVTQDSTVLVGG